MRINRNKNKIPVNITNTVIHISDRSNKTSMLCIKNVYFQDKIQTAHAEVEKGKEIWGTVWGMIISPLFSCAGWRNKNNNCS